MASKVYFADFRCPSWRENLQQKLARLMMTAGFGDIDMDGKYVAIKMHFGDGIVCCCRYCSKFYLLF